ncbi:pyridoxamine 5'-phosphate oxidase-related, FMN binding [Candidatus Methanoperedens nitroreducens]|uniref:Pyridoxamine 5'-phosphate oxidase-related, FMN binding n=1 Tax=Candidatus Methanoperedens nitratireducens TaxID=1392998 RepID=A0A062VCU0_9EURY|nr:pyridoxamine 5'-phosphate oxidase family protein [Candidatus Methanoperedens nitroreducens]KCZ73449.1 pyridoxamine 5'-phosphate oxidase-related, FMN binding [Candidatus Methanoperedens nitroreducens]MDJ1422595.1 pyridoxamine 5'-phosphate oxidase family protein [Candidatus Methanoperedens sp.]
MVKMPPEIRDVVEKQKPLPIATADKGGVPNVVFVTMWKILDDENIMFVDNFFNKTRKNIEANPNMAIVAYDGDAKKSYQIKGTVDIEEKGDLFSTARAMADSKKLPGKAAFIFHVKEIYDATYGPNAGKKLA